MFFEQQQVSCCASAPTAARSSAVATTSIPLCQLFLAVNDIDHTKTKVKSPQTNGICERFRKAVLQEFYEVAFRKRLYASLEQLQARPR